MMARTAAEHAFTLVEVLVAMLITVIVFGATLAVLEVFQRDNRVELLRNETQDNARNALDRLARELRNVAAPSAGAAGALERAEPYSLVFQTISSSSGLTWGSNATHATRVRYCLAGSASGNEKLWRQSTRWTAGEPPTPTSTACPDSNEGDWETSALLAEHLTNRVAGQERAVFTYGPPSATDVTQIATVEPSLHINLNPGNLPGENQLGSSISLRNVNRPPTAAFTAVQLGAGREVLLDGSGSSDPDGLALTYKWWDNGAELPTSAQQYSTKPLAPGSVHLFKLEVTDPGGLKSTAEKELKIKE